MIDAHGGYTPTPVISHAILTYKRGRKSGLADGIVISPSHNPPDDVGFKYNPPNGGPADVEVTGWIEKAANPFLLTRLQGVARMAYAQARKAACLHEHDYVTPYVADLGNVVDLDLVRTAGVRIGIDPLGGGRGSLLAAHYRALRDRCECRAGSRIGDASPLATTSSQQPSPVQSASPPSSSGGLNESRP